jgi:hypothetical protein
MKNKYAMYTPTQEQGMFWGDHQCKVFLDCVTNLGIILGIHIIYKFHTKKCILLLLNEI